MMDNDINVLGGLFQQIVTDLKNNSPIWEDFLSKTSKLHSSLKTTLGAIALFLDAFQKIADAATNSRGATKDIGTVLTRICLRHRAVESRLKNFTSALVECLVTPLQEKQDEWKRAVATLDKEHTKEYKKIRSDVKKKALEAARLQKKVRKVRGATVTLGGSGSIVGTTSMGSNQVLSGTVTVGSSELVKSAEAAQADLANKVAELHEAEKQAVKMALVEERSRFCLFVKYLKPILNEEMAMVGEFGHMEESVSLLEKYTADPEALPVASEQMLVDLKGLDASAYSFKTPPGSPRSMGSRKSSMCSISSLQSSASSESAASNQTQQSSPTLNALRTRISVQHNLTVGTRLSSVSSQDSGFTSQDTLVVMRMNARGGLVPESMGDHNRGSSDTSSASSNSSTPLSPYPPHNPATATWPNLQETMQFMDMNKGGPPPDRPHTISTAYERGRQRPELSPYTFHPLESIIQSKGENEVIPRGGEGGLTSLLRQRSGSQSSQDSAQDRNSSGYASLPKASVRPPVPNRNSSGERPALPARNPGQTEGSSLLPDFHTTAPDMVVPHPVYMNAAEIFSMKSESEYGSSMSLDYASLQYTSPSDSGLGDASPPQSDISEPYYASTASIRRQKYAMRSRTEGPVVKPPLLPRPAGSEIYRSVIRRPSCAKPPPPARSTSINASPLDSIEGSPSSISNLEDLPPPPPPSDFASEVDYSNLPPPPPEFLLDGDKRITQRSLSVADAVKSLTIVNHQPASPNSVRRSQSVRIRAAENNDATRRARNGVQPAHGRSQSQGRTDGSPKVQRKATAVEPPKVRDGNRLLNRPDPSDPDSLVVNKSSSLLAKTSFLESLNSKLQQQLNQSESTSPKPVQRVSESVTEIRPRDSVQEYAQRSHDLALRVRSYINSRVVPDPTTCRETLMDQIRRGTSLKNARPAQNMGPR